MIHPDTLQLESGLVDDRRLELDREHPLFGFFLFAYLQQDAWSLEQHRQFWQGALQLWPTLRRGRRERLAHALRVLWRRGLNDHEAAAALGYRADSLRRMGAISLAAGQHRVDKAPGLPTWAVTDYALPRIYCEANPLPNSAAYPNLDRELIEQTDHVTRELADHLERR